MNPAPEFAPQDFSVQLGHGTHLFSLAQIVLIVKKAAFSQKLAPLGVYATVSAIFPGLLVPAPLDITARPFPVPHVVKTA